MPVQQSLKSITVIGTGSLACLFAVRLSTVARVQLIGSWQAQIDAINTHGISIQELDGTLQKTSVPAILHPLTHQKPFLTDYVLVLVKSYQTTAGIERIKCCVNPETIILTLQNGLGNIEQLKAGMPAQFVSSGVTMQGANITAPATIVHAGNGSTIIDDAPELTGLTGLFKAAQLPTETARQTGAASTNEVIWRKLIINTAINPLTALLGQPNGFLAQDKAAMALCQATAAETAEIAVLEGAWPESMLSQAATLSTEAARITAPNRSSMLQDICRGNRTEINAICGGVVARAQQHNRSAPMNQLWLELIQQAEKTKTGSAGGALYSVEELVAAAGFE